MANKVYKDAKSALEGVLHDGMMVMCGGFGLVGIPDKLIHAVRDSGVKNLTCVGTEVAKGKETKVFDGHEYVMERGLVGDLALVKAWKGDASGNLVYRKAARNFNPMMATAAKLCIAEVEELVPVGAIDPDHVHTPGIFVKRIFCGAPYDKKIEQRTTRKA